ncbi:ariadne-2 [Coprinopsis cinerea AmutBmut pab1-1]|nr:ariadne-2 [Coprinopsis cinerea AmutBmut pab1-1]
MVVGDPRTALGVKQATNGNTGQNRISHVKKRSNGSTGHSIVPKVQSKENAQAGPPISEKGVAVVSEAHTPHITSGPSSSFKDNRVSACETSSSPAGESNEEETSSISTTNMDKPLLVVHEPNGPAPYRPFTAFGVTAFRTRARLNEICILYLVKACPRGQNCNRIHPTNVRYYKELLQDKAATPIFYNETPGPEADEGESSSDEESQTDGADATEDHGTEPPSSPPPPQFPPYHSRQLTS